MTTTDKTKALLAAATPGPWTQTDWLIDAPGLPRELGSCDCCGEAQDLANTALIVHLRNTAEHYVAVAECLREVIARVDAEAANGEEWVQSPEDAALEKRAREALRALDAAGGGDG